MMLRQGRTTQPMGKSLPFTVLPFSGENLRCYRGHCPSQGQGEAVALCEPWWPIGLGRTGRAGSDPLGQSGRQGCPASLPATLVFSNRLRSQTPLDILPRQIFICVCRSRSEPCAPGTRAQLNTSWLNSGRAGGEDAACLPARG